MINNRQNGRRRGRGGGPRPQGGGGQGQRDSGNRIDNRARGNAAQLLEKYKNMARDAQMSGDRVNTEYYLQFADHYFRVLMDSRSRQDEGQRRPQPEPFDAFDGDDDYGDEGEPIRAEEQAGGREDGRRQDNRDYRRDDGRRDDYRRDRYEGQRRDEGARRDEQPAYGADAAPVEEFRSVPANDEAPVSKRRNGSRSQRSEQPDGLAADLLPPAIATVGSEGEPIEDAPKPRRRRSRSAGAEASAG